jgi:hypothetical protein
MSHEAIKRLNKVNIAKWLFASKLTVHLESASYRL